MSDVVFMAPVNAGGGTIYGAGHKVAITDEAQVRAWQAEGKVGLAAGCDIRGVYADAITTTTATIRFTADFPASAVISWNVDYGPTTAYGTSPSGPGGGAGAPGSISIPLTGLTTNTLYHYRVRISLTGFGYGGSVTTPDYTFRTL